MNPFETPPEEGLIPVDLVFDEARKSAPRRLSVGEYDEDGTLAENSTTVLETQGRVIGCEYSTSKAGNKMIVWRFVVTEGRFAGIEFSYYTVMTEAAKFKLAETLRALGIDPGPFNRSDVMGKGVTLTLRDEVREGYAPEAKVARVKPHPKGVGYTDVTAATL